MRTTTIISFTALIALSAGCSRLTSDLLSAPSPQGVASPAAAPQPAVPAAPAVPMFHATAMGFDMSKPLVNIDLGPGGLPGVSLQGPEGTRVETERHRARVIQAGTNYSLSINERAFDPTDAHRTYSLIDPQGTYLVDQPDLVIFQRTNGAGVLLNMGVTVGERHFTCSSVATAVAFTRETIDQTVASCRTLHVDG